MMFKRFQNRDYATKEGYQARLTGVPIEKNPYPENSKNWKDWKADRECDRLNAEFNRDYFVQRNIDGKISYRARNGRVVYRTR